MRTSRFASIFARVITTYTRPARARSPYEIFFIRGDVPKIINDTAEEASCRKKERRGFRRDFFPRGVIRRESISVFFFSLAILLFSDFSLIAGRFFFIFLFYARFRVIARRRIITAAGVCGLEFTANAVFEETPRASVKFQFPVQHFRSETSFSDVTPVFVVERIRFLFYGPDKTGKLKSAPVFFFFFSLQNESTDFHYL